MFIIVRLKRLIAFTVIFILLAAGTGAVSNIFMEGASREAEVVILMYHHMLKDASRHGTYVISPDEFEKDLIFLKENGYKTVTASEIAEFSLSGAPLPEKAVMITFDDGYLSTMEYAMPLLLKYDMKAVVSVIVKETEAYSESGDRRVPYAHLTWEDLKKMEQSGAFEVQNHSYDMHKNTKGERRGTKRVNGESVSHYEEEFKKDVGLAQELILKNTGIKPICFTYPFGMISEESVDIVKRMGFLMSLSCSEGINKITDNPDTLYLLKRYNRPHGESAEKILKKCN